MGASRTLLIPNGLDLSSVEFVDWSKRHKQAVDRGFGVAFFIGSAHEPNKAAAELIACAARFFSIKSKRASAGSAMEWYLVIAGGCSHGLDLPTGPTGSYSLNESAPRFRTLGVLSELEKRLWLRAATVGLNPMVSGSGTSLKVAEFVACGLPVVATPLGVRGWEWQAQEHFIACDHSGESLARAVQTATQFMTHAADRGRFLRQQALQLGWDRLAQRMALELDALVALTGTR